MRRLRSFGLSMTVLFALVAYVMFARRSAWYQIPGVIAAAALLAAVFSPQALRPFERVVARVARTIGTINSAIIFSLLYALIFVPVGTILRAFGKDLLKEKIDPAASSYWECADHTATKESYEQIY